MTTFTVTNTNDSGAGSLRQAILDSNAADGSNTIEFDTSLIGQTITILSDLPISANAVINGDIDGDLFGNDITISSTEDTSLFILDSDGVTFDSSANLDIDIDDSFGSNSTQGAILVSGDNSAFINTGIINTSGTPGFTGERLNSIQVDGDNFTFQNLGSAASVISTGRSAIEALIFDNAGLVNITTTVINEGLLEAADDTVRLTNGSITNSGTIRSAGTFDFGGFLDVPGQIADAILFFGPNNESFVGGPNTVDNLLGGFIEGSRSAIFFSGGSVLNNLGIITAEVTAIASQSPIDLSVPSDLIINNSGIIIREGENYGFNGDGATTNATILVSGGYVSVVITNTGLIESTDLAISTFSGATLNNNTGATIISDSDGIDADGIGEDGVAFRGSRLDDFLVEAIITFPSPSAGDVFNNTQGITIDGNGDFVIPGTGTFSSPFGQIEVAFVGADNPLLPLVDLTATQNTGVLTFQSDANGLIYPATIDVTSSTLGVLTVTYVSGTGFDITDSNGDPVFNVPADVDFGDTITNDGLIDGDITTGLGDDVVTNTGTITGDISLGEGNDTVTSGSDDHNLDGGNGDDTAVFSGVFADYSIVLNTDGSVTVSDLNTADGDDGTDILSNFETLEFSNLSLAVSALSSVVNGTSADETLIGTNAADIINGFDGNDVIDGESGDDLIDGGDGFDVSVYAGSRLGFSVTETSGVFTVDDTFTSAGTDEGTDMLTNVEFIRFTSSGTFAADSLVSGSEIDGTAGNDAAAVQGTTGADIINGLAGNDNINASNGNDTLNGGDGDDTLIGGNGADAVNGGDGVDQARYANSNAAVTVSLLDGIAEGGHAEGDFLNSIENLFGSAFDDTLTGDNNDNVLEGFNGNDTLTGNEGTNTLIGGNGDDTFIGGLGADFNNGGGGFGDVIDYSGSFEGVEARLGGSQVFDGGFATGDSFQGIEDLIGSDFNDILVGLSLIHI